MLANLPDDDDDEYERDIDVDELDLEEAKMVIRRRLEERDRMDQYQQRLQRKLQKLEENLASRREEVEGLQRTLHLEQSKHSEEYQGRQRDQAAKARTQEERIRDYLSEVLYMKPSHRGAKNKGPFELDTVLVSFVKPNEPFRYNLGFRIDAGTTIAKLLGSTCKYWGVPPDQYILRTMANNKCQDEILVKECFKQGEIAQLRLERKRKDNLEMPSEEEVKAIQPKGAKRKAIKHDVRYNAEGVDKISQKDNNYSAQLKKMGGIYFLLKLRDSKPSEHVSKVKLRDIIIYSTLAVLTAWVYMSRRPAGEAFWYMSGIEAAFLKRAPKNDPLRTERSTFVPAFSEVSTHEDAWDWLDTTLPSIIWNSGNRTIGTYNLLVGYMAIRAQRVKSPDRPDEFCEKGNTDLVNKIPGAACYHRFVTEDTQDTRTWANLSNYWDTIRTQAADSLDPNSVRSPANPGRWVSAEENQQRHRIETLWGKVSTYDASGYSAHYRMEVEFPDMAISSYRSDIAQMRYANWIDLATRVVIISFTTYNFQYDLWTASDLILEMPVNGAVSPRTIIRPFRVRTDETRAELTETYVDYVRLIIAVYILVLVGIMERRHKEKNHKPGGLYHLSLNGITDLGIVICIFVAVIWRRLGFPRQSTGEEINAAFDHSVGFLSFSEIAFTYDTIFAIEGLIMLFTMYRIVSFFRLNHKVYLLWHTLGEALKAFGFFVVMFSPAFTGIIFIMCSIYGPFLEEYSSLSQTMLQMYNIVNGKIEVLPLLQYDTIWAIITVVVFYIFISLLILNVFAALVVDAYYVVQLCGPVHGGDKFSWYRWYTWALPGLLVDILQEIYNRFNSTQNGQEGS